MTNRSGLSWAAALLLFGGCDKDSSRPQYSSAALVSMQDCNEALDFVRQVSLDRMNKKIDEAIAQFDRGENCGYWYAEGDALAPQAAASTTSNGGTTSGSSHATNASGTNNQVANVDEADFVKNDGKYIYLAQNGVLRIIDGYPGNAAREISKTPLDGTPRKLFVEGNRALVYLSVTDPRTIPDPNSTQPYRYQRGECTYGYGCDFTGDGTSTKLVVFDLADRAAPKKLREIFLSGSLIAARRIENATHTVVSDNIQLFPELKYYPESNLCDYQQNAYNNGYNPYVNGTYQPLAPPADAIAKAHAAYESLREANAQVIASKDLSQVLPRLGDSANPGSDLAAGNQLCGGLYRSQLLDGASFTTLVSVDMSKSDPVATASIVSSPGAVYASGAALYMAVPSEQTYGGGWYDGWQKVEQLSSVHKFKISNKPAETGYIGSGIVKGRVLNQFAMDEHEGYLRIATTSGHVPSPDVESQLTVFADRNNALTQEGQIEHIAPTEDIRSVRFDGDRGFIVTFKKTDPLYALDLSSPRSPKIMGELKIPGFSTYMHLLAKDRLLAIGYDADDHGSFAYFNSVLIQLFDVSDMSNPTLLARHAIGTRGSSSEALTNHLAFTYFEPLKMLAVPMTICEGGGDGQYGTNLTFSGLMLFNIDPAGTIAERGRISHPVATSSTQYGGSASCSNWWTNASSEVKRSIFMDQFVYSISDSLMKIQSVASLGTDLQSFDLGPVSTSQP